MIPCVFDCSNVVVDVCQNFRHDEDERQSGFWLVQIVLENSWPHTGSQLPVWNFQYVWY